MSSKLIVDQKNVKYLFQDKKATFLIPDYQRPYAWEKTNVRSYGKTYFPFHSRITTATASILQRVTFSVL